MTAETVAERDRWIRFAPGCQTASGQTLGRVLLQEQLAHDTYRLRIEAPDFARKVLPGQFLMLRSPSRQDPLLGRPFALYDRVHDSAGALVGFDVVYHVIGKGTGMMRNWTGGEPVELWGPLGNGFPTPDVWLPSGTSPPSSDVSPRSGHLMCIGGGIGYTPFLAVVREALGLAAYGSPVRKVCCPVDRVTMVYGARSQRYLADVSEFEALPGLALQLATDDGTAGHHGFVTDLLLRSLDSPDRPDAVYCCGPEPMMHAVAKTCEQGGVRCWMSLETPMACGFGACFSCVTRVRTDDPSGWDYRRTCVEGPVFESTTLFSGD
ncbi:MAG: dihydroorotate dehydrogenase electron transfer subunit [Planctomycetaceae bacterium]